VYSPNPDWEPPAWHGGQPRLVIVAIVMCVGAVVFGVWRTSPLADERAISAQAMRALGQDVEAGDLEKTPCGGRSGRGSGGYATGFRFVGRTTGGAPMPMVACCSFGECDVTVDYGPFAAEVLRDAGLRETVPDALMPTGLCPGEVGFALPGESSTGSPIVCCSGGTCELTAIPDESGK